MRSYQKEDIVAIYESLMKSAYRYADKGKWLKALKDLESAAEWAYSFNWIYTDENAELLLKHISVEVIPQLEIQKPISSRCVLADSFCMDNRGLTQQYLRAMMQNNMEVLYICTSNDLNKGTDILRELDDYQGATTLLFEEQNLNKIEIARTMVKEIVAYSPKHIFLHLSPRDTVALLACSSITGSCIYNINLTDHAYWMGKTVIDYNIEFRPYGRTVSLEKRGFRVEQLLSLPFYPVNPLCHQLKELPPVPENAIKVFTGGSLYKMLGKDDIFFKIMGLVLSINPNVYIYVAGFDSSKLFDEKCSKIVDHERIIPIGIRKDIDAVFDMCDIYLSTYPTSGGLMSQFAAKHGKPIIEYHDANDVENATEEMVNHFQDSYSSFTDLAEMMDYAKRLLDDVSFRHSEGAILRKGLMNADCFSESFMKMIRFHTTQWDWAKDVIDYDAFFVRYLELENQNGFSATLRLVREQRLSLFGKLPGYRGNIFFAFLDVLKNLSIKHQIRKIVKRYA